MKPAQITHTLAKDLYGYAGRFGFRGFLEGLMIPGDKVWIGANTVIVGAIHIGNDVLIAPNSFVNFDVPSNSLVISNKCDGVRENKEPPIGIEPMTY